MTTNLANTALALPPKDYDQGYMTRLVSQIRMMFTRADAIGPFTCGSDLAATSGHKISALTIVNVPTSPTGLPSGSVWSDGGTLKIVS